MNQNTGLEALSTEKVVTDKTSPEVAVLLELKDWPTLVSPTVSSPCDRDLED